MKSRKQKNSERRRANMLRDHVQAHYGDEAGFNINLGNAYMILGSLHNSILELSTANPYQAAIRAGYERIAASFAEAIAAAEPSAWKRGVLIEQMRTPEPAPASRIITHGIN